MSQELEQTKSRETNADSQPQKPYPQPVEVYRPKRWVPIIFVSALLAVGAVGVWFILWASRAFSEPTAALTFIMGSIISLFLLLSAIATTCIYWGQRNIMLQQWRAMRAQLSVAENQTDWVQIQAQAATGQIDALTNQVGAMINQTTLMALSLEETRKIAEQNADVVKAMQGQLDVMRGQTAVAERSLKLGTRAYVCLSDLQVDFTKTKQLSIKFENIGKVPAEKLDVRILITVTFPEPEWVISDKVRPFNNYEIKRNYGVNALYPGTFKAEIRLWLEHYLNETEIMLLGEGKGFLSVVANVYYGDGFDENQRSAFVFTCRDGGWTMHPVWPDSRGSKSEEDRENKGERPN